VQPGFVQGLVGFYGLSEQAAGYIASAEVWGIALTTLVLALGGHQYSWQRILRGSLLLFVAGNLLSLAADQTLWFAWWRFVTGIGSGGLVSITFTVIGLTRNSDRNFGYLIMGVLSYGALGLWVMPVLLELIGVRGLITGFALFGLSGWWCLSRLPDSGEEHLQVNADAVDMGVNMRCFAILAMFTYFLAQGVIWAYLFLIGTNAGMSEQAVANGLMVSQFLGIAGALVAAMAGCHYGRILPLAVGILGGALVLSVVLGGFSALAYVVTVCVYNFAWNMSHPFLLAAMASFDRHGRVVVYAVAAQMMGLAVGPALAATLLSGGDYNQVVWAGIGLFVLSYFMILVPLLSHRRQRNASLRAAAATG
jgi:predicted MFS family arabinose efflux permease